MSEPNVLNPQLYKRVCEVFGEVRIANQGLESHTELEAQLEAKPVQLFERDEGGSVASSLYRQVIKGGEYMRCCCPFCGDSKFRLWISYLWSENHRLAYCYNETACLSHAYNRSHLQLMLLGGEAHVAMPIKKGRPSPTSVVVDAPGAITLVNQLPDDNMVAHYLAGVRRPAFDLEELALDYGVGVCTEAWDNAHWPLVGRVYAPCWMDGQLVFWQGRWPEDLDWKHTSMPKYFNLPGAPRGHLLYNIDRANYYDDITLTEGVFDAWRVGAGAISLLSCKMSAAQRLRLIGWRRRGCVAIMLDGEAKNEAEEIAHSLSSMLEDRVFVVPLPNGVDPGSRPRSYCRALIRQTAERHGSTFSFEPSGVCV